jgi:hypothetical protein
MSEDNDYFNKMATFLAARSLKDTFCHEGPSIDNNTGKLEIKESKIGLRGVFAGEDFKKGDAVEICPTISLEHAVGIQGVLIDYIFPHEKEGWCLLPLGYAMMYNHADHPNCYWKYGSIKGTNKGWITFYAAFDIKKASELTWNYGKGYWIGRGIAPIPDPEVFERE